MLKQEQVLQIEPQSELKFVGETDRINIWRNKCALTLVINIGFLGKLSVAFRCKNLDFVGRTAVYRENR